MARRRRPAGETASLFAFQDIVTGTTGVLLLIALTMALRTVAKPTTAAVQQQTTQADIDASGERLARLRTERDALREQVETLRQTVRVAGTPDSFDTNDLVSRLDSELSQLEFELTQRRRALAVAREEHAATEERLTDTHDDETDKAVVEREDLRQRIERLETSNYLLFNVPPRLTDRVWLVEIFVDYALVARPGDEARPARYADGELPGALIEFAKRQPSGDHWFLFVHRGGTKLFDEVRSELRRLGFATGFELLGDEVSVIGPHAGAR